MNKPEIEERLWKPEIQCPYCDTMIDPERYQCAECARGHKRAERMAAKTAVEIMKEMEDSESRRREDRYSERRELVKRYAGEIYQAWGHKDIREGAFWDFPDVAKHAAMLADAVLKELEK